MSAFDPKRTTNFPKIAWSPSASAIHIYGGDFFAAERSEWDSMTLLEHRSDGERVRRVFEEANARYEASKHIGAI